MPTAVITESREKTASMSTIWTMIFAKVDGELLMLEDPIELDKKFRHDISVVVDRLVMRADLRKRLADSIETAVGLADGIVEVEVLPREGEGAGEVLTFSEKFACLKCGTSMPELEPRIFSFNSPHGACERCTGLGSQMEIDPELVVPDPTLTIREGALAAGVIMGLWVAILADTGATVIVTANALRLLRFNAARTA